MRILVSLLVLLALTTMVHARRAKVAILTLEGPSSVARELTEGMRFRAKVGTGPLILAPGSEVAQADAKKDAKCASEATQCMASIGAALGAEFLIFGHVEATTDGYRVSVKLLDVAKKRVVIAAQQTILKDDATGARLQARAKRLYNELVKD